MIEWIIMGQIASASTRNNQARIAPIPVPVNGVFTCLHLHRRENSSFRRLRGWFLPMTDALR